MRFLAGPEIPSELARVFRIPEVREFFMSSDFSGPYLAWLGSNASVFALENPGVRELISSRHLTPEHFRLIAQGVVPVHRLANPQVCVRIRAGALTVDQVFEMEPGAYLNLIGQGDEPIPDRRPAPAA